MRKRALVLVAVACLIGAVLAALSTSQYLRIHEKGLEEKSFCALSKVIDCDIASASSYATFAGVPVAWLGLISYVVMGGMALFGAISKKDRKATVTVAWFLSLAAVLYSIRMGYVLAFVLGVACLECIGMYVVNLIAAIGLWIALKLPLKNAGRFFADYVKAVLKKPATKAPTTKTLVGRPAGKPAGLGFQPRIAAHAVVIIAVFGFGWIMMYDVQGKGAEKGVSLKEKIDAHYMQSLYDIPAGQDWPVWGNRDGAVTIIEFSDFECPYCKVAAFNMRPYLQEFKKDVRYYFVSYPLDQSCNPYLEHPMHMNSCAAAFAAECAKERGDFWSFHDEIFRMHRNINRDALIGLAEKRKWDPKEFAACMDSEETKKRILAGIEAGKKAYISGTPSFIIDGRRLKYWRDSEFLQAVVKREIKRSK